MLPCTTRRLSARLALATLLAATTTSGCGSTAEALQWRSCDGSDGPRQAQCATLTVPLDPEVPAEGQPTITLALDRLPATGKRIGSLVVNPGGPGDSAVDELPELAALLSPGVRAAFDIVGYDPPGVGHSDPVSC